MRKSVASCLLLLVALLATVCAQTPAPAPALSQPIDQCLQCQTYGQCALAYKGMPGQFCGKWVSAAGVLPCCCPANSACAMPKDSKACLCKEVPPPKKSTPIWVWILVAIGVILIGVGIYFCFCRPSADDEVVFVETQQPVYVQQPQPVVYQQQQYGQQPVVYQQQPMYVQQTVVHDNDGGMGVGAGVAIGAAAGLVGGLALGAALDSGAHGGGGGGYGGGYGGGDDEGTFGGDF